MNGSQDKMVAVRAALGRTYFTHPNVCYDQIQSVISMHPLLFASDQNGRLQVDGTIVTTYMGRQYNTPLSILIPNNFPAAGPIVSVPIVSPKFIFTANHPNVNPSNGLVTVTSLSYWNPMSSNLSSVVTECVRVFSDKPPLRAVSNPAPNPAPSSLPTQQTYAPHQSNTQSGFNELRNQYGSNNSSSLLSSERQSPSASSVDSEVKSAFIAQISILLREEASDLTNSNQRKLNSLTKLKDTMRAHTIAAEGIHSKLRAEKANLESHIKAKEAALASISAWHASWTQAFSDSPDVVTPQPILREGFEIAGLDVYPKTNNKMVINLLESTISQHKSHSRTGSSSSYSGSSASVSSGEERKYPSFAKSANHFVQTTSVRREQLLNSSATSAALEDWICEAPSKLLSIGNRDSSNPAFVNSMVNLAINTVQDSAQKQYESRALTKAIVDSLPSSGV